MIDMIAHLEATADPLGHAEASPQIGGKAASAGPAQQIGFQFLTLVRPKLRRTPRSGLRRQSAATALAGDRLPATHAAPVNAQPASHLHGRITLLEKNQRTEAALFQLPRTPERSHHALREESIGHYLSRTQ